LRLKTLAVVAGVLLVAAFAATAIVIHYLDPRSLAESLAASVKADTGRELSFGAVEVTLLPRPALVLSQLRFGNAAWGSRPWLAQAERVSAELDAQPASGRMRLSARGTLAGTSVEATGTIGALAALRADAPAYPVDLDGKVGAAAVSLHSTIDKPRGLDGLAGEKLEDVVRRAVAELNAVREVYSAEGGAAAMQNAAASRASNSRVEFMNCP
jgi:uncharacterized protein involved in outer membrane biogenesis